MMSFVKKNKYILVAAAILLAGSYGGYKYYQSTQVTTAAVKMGEVKKGNIVETVSATGALSAQDNVDISSKITGRIVEVLVKENQHVNAGDVLVRLDATSLNATLAQMQTDNIAKIICAAPGEFDRIYDQFLEDYKNAGGQESAEEQIAAYKQMGN